LETVVYIWHYALLVVLATKEEEEECGTQIGFGKY